MKIKRSIFLLITILPLLAKAQHDIPVNLFTGTPDIKISLGGVGGHGLYDNIYLYYNTKGLAINARQGYYGVGWNLSTYGITREVRGIPDDFPSKGWFFNQNNANTGNFSNSSDNSTTTCADELSDYNYINALNANDTEPDLFHYSIPGHSGSFVFDNGATPSIRLIPYADIKVKVKYTSTNAVAGFSIITNDGNRYVFNTSSTASKATTRRVMNGQTQPVEFESTDFKQYTSGTTSYRNQWLLDSIKAPNKAYLHYVYQVKFEKENDPLYFTRNSLNLLSFDYNISSKQNDKLLKAIYSSSGAEAVFNYNNDLLYEVVHYDKRRTSGSKFVKKYTMLYDQYYPCPLGCDLSVNDAAANLEAGFNWAFLKSVREGSACSKTPATEFSYITPHKFPMPVDPAIDAWGYYNLNVTRTGAYNLTSTQGKVYVYPQLQPQEQYRMFPITNFTGTVYEINSRSFLPVQDSAKIGVLQTIKFPSGGTATLDFELNEFYDPVAQETYKAGGLRVKSTTFSDGLDNSKNIITNFSYTTANGISSGKLLSQPKFIIPTDEYKSSRDPITYVSYQTLVQQGSNPWTYLGYKSYLDVSTLHNSNENSVVYATVRVSKPGQGYTVTDFAAPATWGESNSGDWQASTVKIARSSACNSVDFIPTGTYNIYPYPTNPIYRYAQGLPVSDHQYTEQGVRVRESIYTYHDVYKANSTAYKVWGLRYEKVPYWADGYLFSKYFLLTDADKVLASVTKKEYDVNDPSKFVTTVQSYFYESSIPKLLSRTEQTTADGTKYTKRFKYPLDFGSISETAGEGALMIKKLQESNRTGNPIETYTTVTPLGGSAKTVSAGTTILSAYGGTEPLPKYILELNPVEVSDFTFSSIQSGQLVVDARYDTVNTILSYSPYAIPATSIGDDRVLHGSITGYTHTASVVEVSDAAPDQLAFSDFETTTTRSFEITGTLATGKPRSGYKSIHPTVTLSKVLKKGDSRYVLSGWLLKKQAVALNLFVKNTAKTQTYFSQALNYSAGGSAFEYFEYSFPVDGSLTDFVIEIQCTVPNAPANSDLMPLLDDVAVYPANAELKTNTYHLPFGITSSTNRDQTGYIVYDDLGRIQLKKDKHGNILERNTYYYPGLAPASLTASFTYPSPVYLSQPVTFSAQTQSCLDEISYQWDVGQGYVNGNQTLEHTFESLGTHDVKIRISHPTEGVREYQSTVNVVLAPDQTAYFTYTTPNSGGGNVTFTARDNSNLGSNVVYEWNFGQGYFVDNREVTRVITATQIIYLRVTSDNPAVPAQVFSRVIKITGDPY